MRVENVSCMEAALGLSRRIVGVRFLYTWAEYQDSPGVPYDSATRFCVMVKRASENGHFKCRQEHFGCGRSRRALGIVENDLTTYSGEVYYGCGLYATRAIAKKAQRDTIFINHRIYGIEIAPLAELANADLVIMIGDAYQLMRITQGYAYQYGAMKNIGSVGNQGVCSDLCARPYETDDINVSFLCEGTRRACGWSRNDIGVGLPVNLFDPLTEGVLATLNLIETPEAKDAILSRLQTPDALGVDIDPKGYYGVSCGKWYQKRAEDERRLKEYLAAEDK